MSRHLWFALSEYDSFLFYGNFHRDGSMLDFLNIMLDFLNMMLDFLKCNIDKTPGLSYNQKMIDERAKR